MPKTNKPIQKKTSPPKSSPPSKKKVVAKKVAPKVVVWFIAHQGVVIKDGAAVPLGKTVFAKLTYVLTTANSFKTQESSVSASDIVLLPEMILHARQKDTPGRSLLARLCLSCG
jgi:hypothetical protein